MLPEARLRVLCVDDDEDSRVMLTELLKLALIEAKAVGTAAQALSSIQSRTFRPIYAGIALTRCGWL